MKKGKYLIFFGFVFIVLGASFIKDTSFFKSLLTSVVHLEYNQTELFDLSFDKYFEDEGYESYRPSSSEFYLFDKKDMETVIQTITLSTEDVDPNDSSHWIGKFENIPKYYLDGTEVEYAVREKEIEGYINSYDSDKGLYIKFNERTNVASEYTLKLFIKDETGKWYNYDYEYGYLGNSLGGVTLKISPDDPKLQEITEAEAMDHINTYASFSDEKSIVELVGKDYPESYHPFPIGEGHSWHYKYTSASHTNDFYLIFSAPSWSMEYGLLIDEIGTVGNEVILTSLINIRDFKIIKKWDDIGHENVRPNSVEINVVDESNTIINNIVLSEEDKVDNYTWIKEFKIPKYDSNGKEINYKIVEVPLDNYLTIYDIEEDEHNGLAITFSDDSAAAYICYEYNATTKKYHCLTRQAYNYGITSYNQKSFIGGHTINVPGRDFYLVMGNEAEKVKVSNISPINFNFIEKGIKTEIGYANAYPLPNSSYDFYLDFLKSDMDSSKNYVWHYTWNGSIESKSNEVVSKNIYNRRNYTFEKIWDDEGFEDERPKSVKFNLYNNLDNNTIVKSVTLTNSNIDPNDSKKWNGVFTDIPLYNSDRSVAEYFVTEEINDDYITTYDKKEINGLCIDFGDIESKNANAIFTTNINGEKRNLLNSIDSPLFPIELLKNNTICLPVSEDTMDFYFITTYDLKIKNIYPTYQSEYKLSDKKEDVLISYDGFSGDNIPSFVSVGTYHYTWKPNKNSFLNSDIVANEINVSKYKFEKIWDDEGFEDKRPESVKFNLYNVLDKNTIVKSITLTNSNIDPNNPNKWNGVFDSVPKYNDDGTLAEYYISEESVENYLLSNYSKKVFNGLCIEFGNNVRDSNSSVLFVSKSSDGNYHYLINQRLKGTNSYNYFYREDLLNKTICMPTTSDSLDIYLYGQTNDLDIKNIYPTYQDSYEVHSQIYYNPTAQYKYSGSEYPNKNISTTYRYVWEPNKNNFPNNDIITNQINLINYKFEKIWDDEGLEDKRPESVKFNLYNVLDKNTIVKSITLTNSNIDSNNPNKWNGLFDSVPKYNEDGTLAEYYISEESVENYLLSNYSKKDFNGLCIEFGNNVRDSNSSVLFVSKSSDGNYHYLNNSKLSTTTFYREDLLNKTVCMPTTSDSLDIYLYGQTNDLDIRNIYPTYQDSYDVYSQVYNNPTAQFEYFGSEYPNKNMSTGFHYVWEPNKNNFPNSDVITNEINYLNLKFEKIWDDEGFEYNRPESIDFTLYMNNIILPLKKVTLNKSDFSNGQWNGVFNNLPKYDNSGNKINYQIKESNVDKYTTTYDKKDYNRLCIEFGENIRDNSNPVYFIFKNGNNNYYLKNERYTQSFNPSYYSSDLKNNTLCIPVTESEDFYVIGDTEGLDVKRIYPYVDNNKLDLTATFNSSSTTFTEAIGEELLNIDGHVPIHYTFTSTNENFLNSDIIINKAILKDVSIEKLDEEGNNLSGAELTIYNTENTKILSFITDDNNSLVHLMEGEYILKETKVPVGYTKSKDIRFKVLENGNVEVDGNIAEKISMTNENLKIRLNLVNRKRIVVENVKLQLVDEDGNILKEWKNEKEDLVLKDLIDFNKKYTLKQIEEAEGYINATDILFEINNDGQVVINGTIEEDNRVLLIVDKEYVDITINKKLVGDENKEFNFEISLFNYNGTLDYSGTKNGTLMFVNNKASFQLKPNEKIIIKDVPNTLEYNIQENEDDYDKEIDGKSTGRLVDDLDITFTNIKKNEKSPRTFDSIIRYFQIFIISSLLLITSVIIVIKIQRKRLKNN